MRMLSSTELHGDRAELPVGLRLLPMATGSVVEAKRRGFWLKVARERANLSQEAVAKLLGLSGTSVELGHGIEVPEPRVPLPALPPRAWL